MSWEKMKLSECCESIADGDHQPPPKAKEGIAFVTISNIDRNNRFEFDNTMCVPYEYYESLDTKRIAQVGDVLYSVVGSFGIPVLIREGTPRFVFQRHIAILRPNDLIDSRFLFYTMLSKTFYAKADAVAIGAAQRTISLSALRNIEINVPSMNTQRRIADILSAYDDLIENNQQQIKLLEEAAQRLYKEWFVDLCFPGYEHTPVVDGVPEGWEKKTVGEIIGKVARTKQVQTSEYLTEGSIPVIDQSRDFIAGYTNDIETIVHTSFPVIVFGDHTRILKLIHFPFAKGADGTQLLVSNCVQIPQHLLYCSLVNIDLSNHHYARHFKYLKAEEILVPTRLIADKFESKAIAMYEKVCNCRMQINRAAKLRDLLLQKLMNGEIEVLG